MNVPAFISPYTTDHDLSHNLDFKNKCLRTGQILKLLL